MNRGEIYETRKFSVIGQPWEIEMAAPINGGAPLFFMAGNLRIGEKLLPLQQPIPLLGATVEEAVADAEHWITANEEQWREQIKASAPLGPNRAERRAVQRANGRVKIKQH